MSRAKELLREREGLSEKKYYLPSVVGDLRGEVNRLNDVVEGLKTIARDPVIPKKRAAEIKKIAGSLGKLLGNLEDVEFGVSDELSTAPKAPQM